MVNPTQLSFSSPGVNNGAWSNVPIRGLVRAVISKPWYWSRTGQSIFILGGSFFQSIHAVSEFRYDPVRTSHCPLLRRLTSRFFHCWQAQPAVHKLLPHAQKLQPPCVHAAADYDDGAFFFGGCFSYAKLAMGLDLNGITRWNDFASSWEAMGDNGSGQDDENGVRDTLGRVGTVYALALANSTTYGYGRFSESYRLYAGGNFARAGSQEATAL